MSGQELRRLRTHAAILEQLAGEHPELGEA
jgi:hypothetical protein